MTSVAGAYWEHGDRSQIATFSPNGAHFGIVLRRGNLRCGCNVFTLLVWATTKTNGARSPITVAIAESRSNDDGIAYPTWSADGRFVFFIATDADGIGQVFQFDVVRGTKRQITKSDATVTTYSVSRDGSRIAYTVRKPYSDLWNEETRRSGIVVDEQPLYDLIVGQDRRSTYWADSLALFVQDLSDNDSPRRLLANSVLRQDFRPLVSPDGKYVLALVFAPAPPGNWRQYDDNLMKAVVPTSNEGQPGLGTFSQLYIAPVSAGAAPTIIDAPQDGSTLDAVWAPDSLSFSAGPARIPPGTRADYPANWHGTKFVSEFALSGSAKPIVALPPMTTVRMIGWQDASLEFERVDGPGERRIVRYTAVKRSWAESGSTSGARSARVDIKEGLNKPPRLVLVQGHGVEETILELNPELADYTLGTVRRIALRNIAGRAVDAGLYYPVNYKRGVRYPLVIQTHGFDPDRFAAEGIFSSGYAAQALANRGMFVLQLNGFSEDTAASIDRHWFQSAFQSDQKLYETAVDYLDEAGLIDRNRVGLQGFSITCWSVKYALSHPRPGYSYAAATVSDGFDGSYGLYLLWAHTPMLASSLEQWFGAPPIGTGLQTWIKESPAFNIEAVATPLRIVSTSAPVLMQDWEWFVLSRRLGKPVDLTLLEDGSHVLQKPWDRMVASGGNVDWFDFWLNGDQETSLSNPSLYARWRHLRVSKPAPDEGTQ